MLRKLAVGLGSVVLILAGAGAACGVDSTISHPGSLNVVAGENFWGSIAAQLGGSKVNVLSVVTDPNADPHEYESSTTDARAFAEADLVVLNGAGYDDWGHKLLSANSSSHRRVLEVAQLLGKKTGDNPHFWYDPGYVIKVADSITATYKSIDPNDSAFFDERQKAFAAAIQPFINQVGEIKRKYLGTPVGSTESIFVYMAAALGLNLLTPPEFMNAVAEGTDPPAASVVTFQNQIEAHKIKVLVYNNQASTAVTTNIKALALKNGIGLVGVAETLQPPTATFQDWQLAQLKMLATALGAS